MNVHVSIVRHHCSKGTRQAPFAFGKVLMFNPLLKMGSHTHRFTMNRFIQRTRNIISKGNFLLDLKPQYHEKIEDLRTLISI